MYSSPHGISRKVLKLSQGPAFLPSSRYRSMKVCVGMFLSPNAFGLSAEMVYSGQVMT